MNTQKVKSVVLLFLFLSIFFKIDFRLQTDFECCSDDHDYFIHTETIVDDFDFDYSNQLEGFEKNRNFINNKSAPIGFYGTGLLSTPFMYLGTLLDELTNHDNQLGYSYKLLIYSFSSPFYFFLTFYIFTNIKKELNINYKNSKLLLLFLGTGLPYYAFERFSMTHVFDTFSITCLIYALILYYKYGSEKYIYIISFLNFLTLIIRWTNYQVFLLPFIIQKLFFNKSNFRIRNYFFKFLFTNIFLVNIFLFHTKLIWGIYTLNPRKIYNQHSFVSDYLQKLLETPALFLQENIADFFVTLFTQEFGVFWFSSIIFVGLIVSILISSKNPVLTLCLLLVFGFYFIIINVWQSIGNAYGIRYLYPLITISILLFLKKYKRNNIFSKITEYYLVIFSTLSLLSVLFFEGWEGSQLSLIPIENSYGKYEKFVQPNYLSGLIEGIFQLNPYLKVFTTSFLGLIIFKISIGLFGENEFISILENFGLPTSNPDFEAYVFQLSNIYFVTLLTIIFCLIGFAYILNISLNNANYKDKNS